MALDNQSPVGWSACQLSRADPILLITELKRKFVQKQMIRELVGHEERGGATDNYEHEYQVTQLRNGLNKAEFTATEELVKPFM